MTATRPLRYSINITVDGCCSHEVGIINAELHHFHEQNLLNADALLCGRVIYQMMESAWREPGATGVRPEWMEEWMMPFAATIHGIRKYVVSQTLPQVDWNAELLQGDLAAAVRDLKARPGRGLLVTGVTLPLALAELGLIDEYEFVVHPMIAGRGPQLLAGLSRYVALDLVARHEFASGATMLRFVPTR